MDTNLKTPLKPLIINPRNSKDSQILSKLLKDSKIRVINNYQKQIEELFEIQFPNLVNNLEKKALFIKNHFGNKPVGKCGNWIFFPWNNNLIHLVEEEFFYQIRTARNKSLISSKEQTNFKNLTVGIAGLSVGNSVVTALVYSGAAKNIKLADPDSLSVSNLNRLKTSITNLGENKTYITAKQIYEINPYANLILYPEGINGGNLKEFILGNPESDLIIDEADDLVLKFYLRLAAKAAKKPLLMATDNGFNADIEVIRFDTGKNLGNFALLPKLTLEDVAEGLKIAEPLDITDKERFKLIIELIGADNIPFKMKEASMLRIENKLAGWPQLAITAFIAGSLAAYAALQIANGTAISGKASVLIDSLFDNPSSTKSSQSQKKLLAKFDKFLKKLEIKL